MPRGRKRLRAGPGPPKRVNKHLISLASGYTQSAGSQLLFTATYPSLFGGLRWSFTFASTHATIQVEGHWAIVLVRDTEAVNALEQGAGSTLYRPEQHVLAFGSFFGGPNYTENHRSKGVSKTSRKMQEGDKVFMIWRQLTVNGTGLVGGAVQYFITT